MNYEAITTCDVANGEGIGVVLWVSGCDIHCPGCHNQNTWDPNSGKEFDAIAVGKLEKELNKPYITRLTISGGHPLMPCNRETIRMLLQKIKVEYPDVKIWLYTGYEYDKLDEECKYICDNLCDVIVAGPYIEGERDVSIAFRGSKNQIIVKNNDEN